MPDNALSSVPASPPEAITGQTTHSGADRAGTASTLADSGFTERIVRASADAVGQHIAETTRRPGQRGPDKSPRKARGFSVESLGNGAGEPSLAEASPEPLGGVMVDAPAFDEATTKKVVEIGIDLLNDGAAAVVRAIAKKQTGDAAHAEEAAQSVRMSEKYRETIEFGAVACARKYAVNMAYAPEMMLGGGLVLWLGQIALVVRAEKAKGAELRQRAKEQGKEATLKA